MPQVDPHEDATRLAITGPRARVLGLPVDCVTLDDTLAWMSAAIDETRREAGSAGAIQAACQLVTLNPEGVMTAKHNAALRSAILGADLVVPDGIGVVWATRLLGAPVPQRVAGVDLLDAFCALAAERGYRVFLVGAAPCVAEQAARRLEAKHDGLIVAGTYPGSPDDAQAHILIARIRAARPDAVFVAFGAPAQESWIACYRGQLGAGVAIGVGGALDFLAGRVSRAPRWMRDAGLEWCYRLWRQPWRWRRMLALPRFAIAVAGETVRMHLGHRVEVGDNRGQR
jgi:N-acetylglucosaminyldiphosphoundecaprenol N-acetyl-beta-D-mannosaminyltransferase